MAFIVLKQRPGAMPQDVAVAVVDVKRVEPDSASPGDCVIFLRDGSRLYVHEDFRQLLGVLADAMKDDFGESGNIQKLTKTVRELSDNAGDTFGYGG